MTPERNAPATWSATLGQLELQVTRANFDTWLRDTVGLRHEDDRFVVGAANDFAVEWLSTKLRALITRTLARVLGHAIDVTFEVVRQEEPELPALLAPAGDADHGAEIPEMYRKRRPAPPALNPSMTFDAFVVGEENRLAYEAARSAVANPGAVNPLVIFGLSGLGKTHLLNAIGHAAYADGRAVIYAPAERFGNDFVRALNGGLEQFRNRYRTCDVLILDDVQFFEGKEKFQDELFHAFNDLHAAGKQIVVSSDRLPSQLGGLVDALRSRLHWGLIADLQKPSYDTRLAILRAKASQHAARLPDAALMRIAERCCPTVRELEGYLNRVLAYAPLVGGAVTDDVIDKALSPLSPSEQTKDAAPAPERIIDAVCHRMGTTPAALASRSRSRDLTYARHLAMYLLKEDGKKTIADIGRAFGNRDHSTVIGGIQRIVMELTTRPETAEDLAAIRAQSRAVVAAEVG